MKRIVQAVSWLIAIVLIALSPFFAALLPSSRHSLVHRSLSSWSGVLRIWKCEGWQSGSGSLTPWLNACVAAFEKRHPGVYIQISDVSAETLRAFSSDELNPPDAVIFAPGMLESPESLLPLSTVFSLKPSLRKTGFCQGAQYAVPIAMGGYALAVNTRLMPETPENWSDHSSEETVILHCPKDSDYLSWSAALLALFSGSSAPMQENVPIGDGVNLGLPDLAPSPTPDAVRTEPRENALPQTLPDAFRKEASVYSLFTSGKAAAIPVTQREIVRLNALSESGKAPDWRIETMGLPFSDQLSFFSVVNYPRKDAADRQRLCADFLSLLLSEEMQKKLTSVRAFPVFPVSGLYSSAPFAYLEQALASDLLIAPCAFGSKWRQQAALLADALSPASATNKSFLSLQKALNPEE